MRRILLPFLSLLLIAATPSQDARRLLDRGQDGQAFALLEAASGRGDLDALDYLAWFYDTGRFVARDQPRAAAMYRRAALVGQAHAQWRLGVMLDMGEGVAEDPVEALAWIRRAAAQDFAEGVASLAVMYANGRGVAVDYGQSMLHYRRAARLGTSAGFYGVGVLHAFGQGVARDPVEAAAWFIVATILGDQRSTPALQRLALGAADSRRAAARADAILREFGREERVRYQESPAPVT
jgi:uncharacterized protein